MQDWIKSWLRRHDREFEESVSRDRESQHARNLPSDVQEMVDQLDRDRHQRDQFPVGAFFESIDANRQGGRKPSAEMLLAVAEVGQELLYAAVCRADTDDNAEFFVEAYGYWGPLVDTVLQECACDLRNSNTGRRLGV